jgi:succinate dehydrogenase/fumarate reductase flavoprotein subunit
LQREESRGSQFRNDFPEAREEWAHRSTLTLSDVEEISKAALSFEPRSGNVIQLARS